MRPPKAPTQSFAEKAGTRDPIPPKQLSLNEILSLNNTQTKRFEDNDWVNQKYKFDDIIKQTPQPRPHDAPVISSYISPPTDYQQFKKGFEFSERFEGSICRYIYKEELPHKFRPRNQTAFYARNSEIAIIRERANEPPVIFKFSDDEQFIGCYVVCDPAPPTPEVSKGDMPWLINPQHTLLNSLEVDETIVVDSLTRVDSLSRYSVWIGHF